MVDRQWASAIPASNAASSVASKACAAVVGEHQCGLLDITGDHELIYGEVDDARAAVRWLGEQPGSDGARPPPSQP